ncbi:hypothetical protein AB1286_01885 [Trinickia sp. NRRL B-1857]|uniref:hypothetical protein n=1 Tax=Trinickia sp. NRRL B-1857 TaxID=3162879 RepID=UPI003D2A3E7F
MSNLPSFYTQAGNFRNDVEGSVDPRTGMFNVSIKLGEVVGNNHLGPTLPIALSYSPLASLNGPTTTVFGPGVSLNTTQYDTSQTPCRLSLSTGEQYIVNDDTMEILQKKLDHVRIEKGADNYKITYRSGAVEILDGPGAYPSRLKMPKQLINHLGHSLTLHWNTSGPVPRLDYIVDDNGTKLLSVDYSQPTGPTFTFYPGQTETYDVQLLVSDGILTIKNFSLGTNNPLIWTLTYDTVGQNGSWGAWVTGVTTPGQSGNAKTESVQYLDDGTGASFPDSSTPPLPLVASYTRDPGCQQPPIVSKYAYLGGSFLGANTGGASSSTSDALYGVFDDYTYGSVETKTCGADSVVTTRKYNRYHLLIEEKVNQNGYVRTVTTEYANLKKGKTFDQQVSNCQCPTKKTTTWTSSGNQQQHVVVTKYDDQGNLTESTAYEDEGCQSQCSPKTTWAFYVGDGSDGTDCPQDPLGFSKRFMKSVTKTPYLTSYSDVPSLTTVYRYTDIS